MFFTYNKVYCTFIHLYTLRPRMKFIGTKSLSKNIVKTLIIIIAILFTTAKTQPGVVHAEPLSAPLPTVTLNVDNQVLIGEDFSFSAIFNNSSSDVGFGPYIDIYLPQSGADDSLDGEKEDGITYTNVDYLGNSIRTWNIACEEGTNITHPLTDQTVVCPNAPAGTQSPFIWQLLVVELPFGSFVNGQPQVVVDIDAVLSDYADSEIDLPIIAQAGFRFGADALDNPSTDPPIIGSQTSNSITPVLFILDKEYSWRESETSTGTNYLRQYTITVDIPENQVITNLTVTDDIPDNMQFVEVISSDPAGATCTTPSTTEPNGTLSCLFDSVTGTADAVDASLTYSFYIPLKDLSDERVINPLTGGCVVSENPVSTSAEWDPNDPRDETQTITASEIPAHILEDCSHTIQNFEEIITDISPEGLSPGDVIEYRLEFQISDYFAYDGFSITDTISDGQHLLETFTPTLSFEGNGFILAETSFDSSNYTVDHDYTPVSADPNTGTTTIVFNISDEILFRGQANGYLIGGCIPASGTEGLDPNCITYNDEATTGIVKFRTTIQEEFSDDYPSGDPSVDQGDRLTNDVVAEGTVLNNSDLSSTSNIASEDSGVALVLEYGSLTKSIYAVNGSTTFPNPVTLSPNDTISFRYQYTLPTSDVEDLAFTDFLPLPILDADEITVFDDIQDATIPAAGHAKFGNADTFRDYSGIVPSLSIDSPNNSFTLTYGDFDSTNNTPTKVDVLFTVTVSNDPFADELYLTNEIFAYEGSTNNLASDGTSIIQFVLYEPNLTITKGAVASDHSGAEFNPVNSAPVTFTAPGSACPRFSDTINSENLAITSIDSDISGVDAGDLVTFALVIENTGHSNAYDVRIKDDLPSGFIISGSGMNLCVTDGSGTALDYTDIGSGLFDGGIELNDPAGGALQAGYDENGIAIADGTNIAIITFDLEVDSTVTPEQVITNTTTLYNYSGWEGSADFTSEDLLDSAITTVLSPNMIKEVSLTNQSHTSGTDVVIGETATYTITLTIPEGQLPNAQINETLPVGATFEDCISISASTDLSTDLAGGFSDACNPSTNPEVLNNGREISFDLGNMVNNNTVNGTAEILEIEFTTVALNVLENQAGSTIENTAFFSWDSGIVSDSATELTVVEPNLTNNKAAVPASGDAGDMITFTITVTNPSNGTDSYDVTLDDIVPSALTYQTGSFNFISGLAPTSIAETPDLNASWDEFPAGSSSQFSFTAVLTTSVTPGDRITNDAIIKFTSLPDEPGQQSSYNTDSYERTGDETNPGGELNDYFVVDSAYVDIVIPTPEKYLIDTSEPDTYTSGTDLSIGEIARYRLSTKIPEGTSIGFQIRDLLPAGLVYLDDGTARLAFVSNGSGITSSTITCTNDSGSAGDPIGLPTGFVDCTFPVGSVTNGGTSDAFTSGSDPWFDFGNLINADDDVDSEYIVVEFNALAVNVIGNQSGTTLHNDFRVYEGGSQVADANHLDVTIVEPQINVDKAVSSGPYEAGDPITYTITISNSATANSTTAFDLQINDVFDSALQINSHSLNTPVAASAIDNSSGNTINVYVDRLKPGESVNISVEAVIIDTTSASLTIPNTANVKYTSLTGINGTTGNSTGSDNSGASGSDSGERTGQDGAGLLNDYVAEDPADIETKIPSIDKQAPSPLFYTIGENTTYPILVNLPDGTTTSLRITDLIPAGMEYVSHEIITSAVLSDGLLAEDYSGSSLNPTVTTPGGSGVDLGLDFGDVITTANIGDPEPDNNNFLVKITLRVLDESANANGSTLDNSAALSFTDPDDASIITLTDGPETITVIEPVMHISKTFNPDLLAINETTQVTLVVTNTGTSPAYDVIIEDPFPLDTFQSLTEVSTPGDFTFQEVTTVSDRIAQYSGGPIEVGGTRTFIFNATVGNTFPSGTEFVNTAVVSQATTINGPDAYERDEPDVEGSDTLTAISPDLVLNKDDSVDNATPGDTLIYTLTIDNVGLHDSGPITISDVVPEGTVFDSTNSTIGWSCIDGDPAGTTCQLNLPALASGGQTQAFFAVRVDNPIGADITEIDNTASVEDSGIYGEDPTPANNEDNDIDTLVGAAPDLAVQKIDSFLIDADNSGMPTPGDTIHYSVTIINSGNQDAGDAIFNDTPDNNTTLVAGSVTTSQGSVTLGNTPGDTSLSINLGDIDGAGGSVTIEFNVTVNDPLIPENTTYVDNQGTTSGSNFSDVLSDDPDLPGDEDPTRTLLGTAFIKALTDTNWTFTNNQDAAIGEIIVYEVSIEVPPGIAANAIVTDTLEAGLAFVECTSITPASGDLVTDLAGGFNDACANPLVEAEPSGDLEDVNQGRKITFDLGNLTNSAGGSVTLTLTYQVVVLDNKDNLQGEERTNQVEWEYGGSTLRTSAEAIAIVEPDLVIEKSVNMSTVSNNQVVTFTLEVRHSGSSQADAFNLEVSDILPSALTYISGSLQQISGTTATVLNDSDPSSLLITWDEFSLNGDTAVIEFETRVNLDSGDSTTNSAYLAWTSLPGDYLSAQSIHNTLSTERYYDPPSDVNIYGTNDAITLDNPRPTPLPTVRPTPTFPATK